MRHLTLLITFCVLFWLAASSPMDPKKKLVNRPTKEEIFGLRSRRNADYYDDMENIAMYFKSSPQPLEYKVPKGHYVCGDKLCRLKPGEIPRGCKGTCQYPIL